MADRKKYVCVVCKECIYSSKKFVKHVMRHAGHKYTVCDNCGIRKRHPDKQDWKTKHGCRLNNKPFMVNVFTVTAAALKEMLIGVCGVIPAHIPALPAPALVLPALGGAEGGAEVEEAESDAEEEERDMDEQPEPEEESEGSLCKGVNAV